MFYAEADGALGVSATRFGGNPASQEVMWCDVPSEDTGREGRGGDLGQDEGLWGGCEWISHF